MPYKIKVFVSFDRNNDIQNYRLMVSWKQNAGTTFNFVDSQDFLYVEHSTLEESTNDLIAERIYDSDLIYCVNRFEYHKSLQVYELRNRTSHQFTFTHNCCKHKRYRTMDNERCLHLLKNVLAMHISFNKLILQCVIENWPTSDIFNRTKGI